MFDLCRDTNQAVLFSIHVAGGGEALHKDKDKRPRTVPV